MQLHDRPIIITGGGSGIGAATARACAAAGMPVVIAGRRRESLSQVASGIEHAGGQCIGVPVDVTDPDHTGVLLEACASAFAPAWAVFANAGRGLDRVGHKTSLEDMRSIFEVNVFATQQLLAHAARDMLQRDTGGHLLACSSCVARFAPPYHAAYSATKAAQDLVCQSMRVELAPRGIHVSTVHPVATTTEFFDVSASISGREDNPSGLEQTPPLFRQSAEHVARAVVRCLKRPRPEVWPSRLARYGAALHAFFPRLFDPACRRLLEPDRL